MEISLFFNITNPELGIVCSDPKVMHHLPPNSLTNLNFYNNVDVFVESHTVSTANFKTKAIETVPLLSPIFVTCNSLGYYALRIEQDGTSMFEGETIGVFKSAFNEYKKAKNYQTELKILHTLISLMIMLKV